MAEITLKKEGAGSLLFGTPSQFIKSCNTVYQLPNTDLPEVAFAGRSNVGKSSLINAIMGAKALARTSKTPGRTQHINLFNISDRLIIADLPGYGYARAPKSHIRHWTALVNSYLKSRANLSRTFVLVDARHGFKKSDINLFKSLDDMAQIYQVVFTKSDKVRVESLKSLVAACKDELSKHSAAHRDVAVTSSNNGDGIPELRTTIAILARSRKLG